VPGREIAGERDCWGKRLLGKESASELENYSKYAKASVDQCFSSIKLK